MVLHIGPEEAKKIWRNVSSSENKDKFHNESLRPHSCVSFYIETKIW